MRGRPLVLEQGPLGADPAPRTSSSGRAMNADVERLGKGQASQTPMLQARKEMREVMVTHARKQMRTM